jgi:hypothetical protein
MKKYEPSGDFVSKVMKDIYAYEETREVKPWLFQRLLSSRPLYYAASAGGILFGIFNIVRLYFSVFAPALCR